jgi:large subunit ribosomal protein L3
VLKEFRVDSLADYEIGKNVTCEIFKAGDKVDVVGTTKGHGFTGAIKRWNQRRLKETHGVGPVHREVGSMGANSSPSRVFKGKKMAGQYGNEKVTVLNLEVVKVDKERNLLLVKGAVPGPKKAMVTIKETVKSGK